ELEKASQPPRPLAVVMPSRARLSRRTFIVGAAGLAAVAATAIGGASWWLLSQKPSTPRGYIWLIYKSPLYGGTQAVGVYALAWSPGGKYLASGGGDKMVRVWDASTGDELSPPSPYRGHFNIKEGTIQVVAWSPDSQRIASASNDGSVQ